jgi:hypothetical protein
VQRGLGRVAAAGIHPELAAAALPKTDTNNDTAVPTVDDAVPGGVRSPSEAKPDTGSEQVPLKIVQMTPEELIANLTSLLDTEWLIENVPNFTDWPEFLRQLPLDHPVTQPEMDQLEAYAESLLHNPIEMADLWGDVDLWGDLDQMTGPAMRKLENWLDDESIERARLEILAGDLPDIPGNEAFLTPKMQATLNDPKEWKEIVKLGYKILLDEQQQFLKLMSPRRLLRRMTMYGEMVESINNKRGKILELFQWLKSMNLVLEEETKQFKADSALLDLAMRESLTRLDEFLDNADNVAETIRVVSEFLELKDDPEWLQDMIQLIRHHVKSMRLNSQIDLLVGQLEILTHNLADFPEFNEFVSALEVQDPTKWKEGVKIRYLEVMRGGRLYATKVGLLVGATNEN